MKQTKISDYGLKVVSENNKYASCHCPLHNDKHASAFIYLDNLWYICPVCHISMPLERLLQEAGLDGSGIIRRQEIDEIDLMGDAYKVKGLTKRALEYLEARGITEALPSFVASPLNEKGVAFVFFNQKGEAIGSQIRLFPENVVAKGYRYIFEGKRLAFFGNIAPHYLRKHKLFVFEKAFATLKAEIAVKTYSLPIAPISAVGSRFQDSLLDMTNVNTTFFFDNDTAGMNAAKDVKKRTGARVIIAGRPLDELTIEEMRVHLEKYL